jgi:hypothetical protein
MKASHEIRASTPSPRRARIRAGLPRPVALPDGTKVRAALDDEDAARATVISLFEPGHVVEDH